MIVDDHVAARHGLSEILETAGFCVVAAVGTPDDAYAALSNDAIEIVVLDVRLGSFNGLATLEQIRLDSAVPIVMVSAYDNPTYVARAATLGAQDYIVKNGSGDELGQCLRLALAGKHPIPDGRMATIQAEMSKEIDPDTLPEELPLTGREAQVLRHVALGLSNKEIARSLRISVETVKEHVQNILRKIKATDRTDAAVRAVKSGLIQ